MNELKSIELDSLEKRLRANFFNKLSGFKSPFLVGTQTDGLSNLALFSNIFHIGSSEKLIGMISRPNTVEKHTIENIRRSKEYTLNFIDETLIDRAHQTSARYDRSQSEFEMCDIEKCYYTGFEVPFVKESPLAMVLILREIQNIKTNGTHLIIGEVKSIFSKKNIDIENFNLVEFSPIAVSGIDTYLNSRFIKKKSYAKRPK